MFLAELAELTEPTELAAPAAVPSRGFSRGSSRGSSSGAIVVNNTVSQKPWPQKEAGCPSSPWVLAASMTLLPSLPSLPSLPALPALPALPSSPLSAIP
jgi:hypothetical protein